MKLKKLPIQFNEADHSYQNTETGDFYTGCTTVADAWKKDFLNAWYAKETALAVLSIPFDALHQMNPKEFEGFVMDCRFAAKNKSDEAKEIGHQVHKWIENHIGGKKQPAPKSEQAKRALRAFLKWEKKVKPKWLASEMIVGSIEHKIAGTLDALVKIGDKTYLLDFKTSSQLSESNLLQCAGYDIMLQEMGLMVDGYILLRLPKDGKDAETLTTTNADDMDFFRQTFLRQREAHKFYVYMKNNFKDGNKIKTDL